MSLGIGAVLLWGGILPVQADNSGVAVYQAAMKQMKAESSLTAHIKLDMTDNGKHLYAMSGEAMVDRDKQEASISGTREDVTGAKTESFQVFREDGKVIVTKRGERHVPRFRAKRMGSKAL